MNPFIKLHLGSAGYCALLIGLNWARSIVYSRHIGLTGQSVEPVALAFLLSAGIASYLVYRSGRSIFSHLETGKKVSEGRWIESWSVIVYALPLLFHRITTSSWIAADGTIATSTGGYGHALSGRVFLFAILGLLLFQVLARLTGNDKRRKAIGSRASKLAYD